MFTSLKNSKKGFTLIELLIVIAIIGILSSVVLASLGQARQKSRDAKRISDLGQVQLALELAFDSKQAYPRASSTAADTCVIGRTGGQTINCLPGDLLGMGYLPKIPTPNGGSVDTRYYYVGTDSANPPANYTANEFGATSYALGAVLERTDNAVLNGDADQTVGTVFYGSASTCDASGGTDQCYDIKP